MKDRGQFERLSKLQESGDNEECWKVLFTEDTVMRITGSHSLLDLVMELDGNNLFFYGCFKQNIF